MRWEYERDGLVALGGVLLLGVAVELAGPGSFVTTFVGAFLGTLTALGLASTLERERSHDGRGVRRDGR